MPPGGGKRGGNETGHFPRPEYDPSQCLIESWPSSHSARVGCLVSGSPRSWGRLGKHEEREFEWGHHKSRPLESVRAKDVYVIQSLHGDREQSVNDKLCRLLFFLGALKDAGAHRLTAVVPFLWLLT